MSIAVRDLEETLASARTKATEARQGARSFGQPRRAAITVGVGVVGALLGIALAILIAAAGKAVADEEATRALMLAPADDEVPSAREERAVEAGRAESARGEVVEWENLRDELKPV